MKDLWKTNQVLFITFYYLALNSADFECRGDDVFFFIVFLREQVWNDCTYLCVCVCVEWYQRRWRRTTGERERENAATLYLFSHFSSTRRRLVNDDFVILCSRLERICILLIIIE